MKKIIVEHPEIKLIGLKVRTINKNEFNPATAKIGPLVGKYFSENIAAKIPNRKNSGITIVGYSNYESDEHGEYDFYFGEEVNSLNNIPDGLASLIVPAGKYLKFTTDSGKMPELARNTWQQIWQMTTENKLGGQRTYKTDFEIYDERAADMNNMIFDIYLGIK